MGCRAGWRATGFATVHRAEQVLRRRSGMTYVLGGGGGESGLNGKDRTQALRASPCTDADGERRTLRVGRNRQRHEQTQVRSTDAPPSTMTHGSSVGGESAEQCRTARARCMVTVARRSGCSPAWPSGRTCRAAFAQDDHAVDLEVGRDGQGGGGKNRRKALRKAQGRLFDCGTHGGAVSAFAQDDR